MREILYSGGRNGGEQIVVAFDNGYAASVIRGPYTYGGDQGLWEVAVLEGEGDWNEGTWSLTYDTPITDDVIGHLSDDERDEVLDRIEALPSRL